MENYPKAGEYMYPSESELEIIENYDLMKKHSNDLWCIIENAWIHRYGRWKEEKTFEDDEGEFIFLSTGGWSGNEDVIRAMRANKYLWDISWVQSQRGGHYVFEKKSIVQEEQNDESD